MQVRVGSSWMHGNSWSHWSENAFFNDMGCEFFWLGYHFMLSVKAMSSIDFQVNNTIIMTSSFYLLFKLGSAKTQFKIQTPNSRCMRDPLV